MNLLAKTFLLTPAIEYVWNLQQNEIFLNSYQEDRALLEMQDFSEETYFDSLLEDPLATSHKNESFPIWSSTELSVPIGSKLQERFQGRL